MSAQDAEISTGVPLVVETAEQPVRESLQVALTRKALAALEKNDEEFYGALGEIQAELEDLLKVLDSIRKGQTIIPTYANYINTTKSDLRKLLGIINATQVPDDIKEDLHTIRHLNNAWEQIQVSPLIADPTADLDVQQQLHYLDVLDDQIHTFQYQLSLLTVPHRINEYLKITGPGYFIPFHEVFADEVPDRDDRDRLLKHIALTPNITPGGFVDSESGRIYRYSMNRWRRMLSLGMVLLSLIVAGGLVAAACYLPAPGWPLKPADLSKMLVAWAAVLIGMGVHVIVGSAKRSKTQNGMPSVLMDLILIIDARFGEIVTKLGLALLGLFGLVLVSGARLPQLGVLEQIPTMTQVTPFNAFLIGYSLDSIIELFGTSMEATSQVKSLVK